MSLISTTDTSYILAPVPTNANGTYTVFCWAYVTSLTAGLPGVISVMDATVGFSVDSFRIISLGGDVGLSVWNQSAGLYDSTIAAGAPAANTWNFWCLVRSSSTLLQAYINGNLITSLTTNVASRGAATQCRIAGYNPSYTGSALGSYSNILVWDRALTADEIKLQSTRYFPVSFSALKAWHPGIGGDTTVAGRPYVGSTALSYNGTINIGTIEPPIPFSVSPGAFTSGYGAGVIPVTATYDATSLGSSIVGSFDRVGGPLILPDPYVRKKRVSPGAGSEGGIPPIGKDPTF